MHDKSDKPDKYKDSEADIEIDIVDQESEYKEWLSFADMDLNCARYLNEAPMHPRPLNAICFHCQQAAEKALKAIIVYYGSRGGMAKKHELPFLFNQIKNQVYDDKHIMVTDELKDMGATLTKNAVDLRYPNEIVIEEHNVDKALKDSESIVDWAKEVLAAPSVDMGDKTKG